MRDKEMADAAIDKCNCMVRYAGGAQLPAVRKGKEFFTPEGYKITPPDSFEVMTPHAIKALMVERGEIYIGHMFTPSETTKS
jgi:hypothetical protein